MRILMEKEKYHQKILIIEDEPGMLNALVDNLASAGFDHIMQARDGEEGLALASKETPDLILLDIVMPKMDGMTLMTQLRQNSETKDTKVILLTNLTADDAIMSGIVANEPSYYMVKVEHSIADVIEKVKTTLGVK